MAVWPRISNYQKKDKSIPQTKTLSEKLAHKNITEKRAKAYKNVQKKLKSAKN